MKHLIVVFLLHSTVLFSQNYCWEKTYFYITDSLLTKDYDLDIDSNDICFKAKLLTTSPYGLLKKENVLTEIENQKSTIYKYPYCDSILFIVIGHSQSNSYMTDSTTVTGYYSFGCRYMLAYDLSIHRFYKLNGFENSDYLEFVKDNESNFKLIQSELLKGFKEMYKLSLKSSKKENNKCSCHFINKKEMIIY